MKKITVATLPHMPVNTVLYVGMLFFMRERVQRVFKAETSIIKHHHPCVRIIQVAFFNLVILLGNLLAFRRIKDACRLIPSLKSPLHILLELDAELRTERQELCFSFQVDAINLLNRRDIDQRVSQLLAHAKEIDLSSPFPVRLRLRLGH